MIGNDGHKQTHRLMYEGCKRLDHVRLNEKSLSSSKDGIETVDLPRGGSQEIWPIHPNADPVFDCPVEGQETQGLQSEGEALGAPRASDRRKQRGYEEP